MKYSINQSNALSSLSNKTLKVPGKGDFCSVSLIAIKTVISVLIVVFAFSTNAQQSLTVTPVSAVIEDSTGKVTGSLGLVKLSIENYPPMAGQRPLIKFDLNDASGKTLTTCWFEQGHSSYHYTYEIDNNDVICRILYLTSSDSNEAIGMWVPKDYSNRGSLFFNFSRDGKYYKAYELILSPSDAKKVFLMVARRVDNLKFKKIKNDTLYIDVDF